MSHISQMLEKNCGIQFLNLESKGENPKKEIKSKKKKRKKNFLEQNALFFSIGSKNRIFQKKPLSFLF